MDPSKMRQYHRDYRERNKEKIRIQKQEYENTPQRIEYCRKYYEANKQLIIQRHVDNYNKHRVEMNQKRNARDRLKRRQKRELKYKQIMDVPSPPVDETPKLEIPPPSNKSRPPSKKVKLTPEEIARRMESERIYREEMIAKLEKFPELGSP